MPIFPQPVLSSDVLSDLKSGRLDDTDEDEDEDEILTRWGDPGEECSFLQR